MAFGRKTACLVGTGLLVVLGATWLPAGGPAWARTPKPLITGLAASPATVTASSGQSTVSAFVSNATSCTLSATPVLLSGAGSVNCSGGSVSQVVAFPFNSSPKPKVGLNYKITLTATGPGGTKSRRVRVRVLLEAGGVALSGVRTVVNDNVSPWATSTYCALLTSGGVDCWGYGHEGELGNGNFYTTGDFGSTRPVQVVGVGGTGTLGGVASITGGGLANFCALLTSGGVDCWGDGQGTGELGNGTSSSSASPVQVVGVGGTGTLSGVAALTADGYHSYCALLVSGGVDCWGNITIPPWSASPIPEEGVGGTGTLSGVASLTTDGFQSYCALLTTGGVDCWGQGASGQLGNGAFSTSFVPVQVVGVGGAGTLSGVASLTIDGSGSYCALLTTGGVDCWGDGANGELGNGTFSNSASPVQVVGVGGTGTLSGMAALTADGLGSYCALLTTGGVDCWGKGSYGELGNGTSSNSASPVQVVGVGGTGTLSKVASITIDGSGSYCALLVSGEVNCWGNGYAGALGNGVTSNSASPVQVVGVGGTGTLSGVAALTADGFESYCALLTTGGVDCWGNDYYGELGNGSVKRGIIWANTPVQVLAP